MRVFNVCVGRVCVSACVVAGVCWRLWSCWLVCGGSEGIDTAEPVFMSRAILDTPPFPLFLSATGYPTVSVTARRA